MEPQAFNMLSSIYTNEVPKAVKISILQDMVQDEGWQHNFLVFIFMMGNGKKATVHPGSSVRGTVKTFVDTVNYACIFRMLLNFISFSERVVFILLTRQI